MFVEMSSGSCWEAVEDALLGCCAALSPRTLFLGLLDAWRWEWYTTPKRKATHNQPISCNILDEKRPQICSSIMFRAKESCKIKPHSVSLIKSKCIILRNHTLYAYEIRHTRSWGYSAFPPWVVKWWEVKGWGESASARCVGKKYQKLYTALSYLHVVYLLYMLYFKLSCVYCW